MSASRVSIERDETTLYGERAVAAANLIVGDQIHHWSPTGGVWRVDAVLRDGRLRLVSDLGAARYFTREAIDEKGAWACRLVVARPAA